MLQDSLLEEKEDMGSDEARQGQLLATTMEGGDEHVGPCILLST